MTSNLQCEINNCILNCILSFTHEPDTKDPSCWVEICGYRCRGFATRHTWDSQRNCTNLIWTTCYEYHQLKASRCSTCWWMQAEIAELKLQKLQSEEQHKQQCELQHKESVAAGMAAAAASWRVWEIQQIRDSLQGWPPECGDTSAGKSAPSLHRTRKLNQGPLALNSLFLPKEKGEQGEQENTELKSAATGAAVVAASLLGSKNGVCSSLGTNTQDLASTNSAPQSISKSSSSASSWDEGNLKEETHDIPAGQVSNKLGKGLGPGLMRSASEGSLHLMESGTEQQQQQQNLLPFIPMAGPRTDPVNGWFSLVPSPVD